MFKISAVWVLSCALSVTTAMAAEVVTTKAMQASIQQVKYESHQNNLNQNQVNNINAALNTTLQKKAISQNSNSKPSSTTASAGLLIMALLCFVLRSSRKKV